MAEQVFCLWLWADQNDRTKIMFRNARGDKAVVMAFSVQELPYFTIWKNPVALEDGYVTGLEPGTGFPRNRAVERRFGRVPVLGPHQSRTFTLDFLVLADTGRIAQTAREIKAIQADRGMQVDDKPLPTE